MKEAAIGYFHYATISCNLSLAGLTEIKSTHKYLMFTKFVKNSQKTHNHKSNKKKMVAETLTQDKNIPLTHTVTHIAVSDILPACYGAKTDLFAFKTHSAPMIIAIVT